MPWKKRYLTSTEMNDVQPFVVEGEGSGVSRRERMIMKNLAANPEAAKRYLQSLGYQVGEYGSGFNFAVRKSSSEPWRPVDPQGFDAGDIADLGADIIMGLLSGAATVGGAFVGGIPGAVVVGGAAGAGLEAGRQALGERLGIPDNADIPQIALAGGLEAAAGPVGKVASKGLQLAGRAAQRVLPPLGRAGLESGARVAGIQGLGNIPRSQVLRELTKATGKRAPVTGTFEQIAQRFVKAIHTLGDNDIPELVQARQMLAHAKTAGVTVNAANDLEPLMELLRAARMRAAGGKVVNATGPVVTVRGRPIGTAAEGFRGTAGRGISEATKKELGRHAGLAEEIEAFLINARDNFLGKVDLRAIPVDLADALKTRMQAIVRDKGAYKEFAQASPAFVEKLEAAAKALRATIERTMDGAGYRDFIPKMGVGSKKLGLLGDFKAMVRETEQQSAVERAEAYLAGLYGKGRGSSITALHDLENTFGVRFVDETRRAAVLRRLGPGGEAEISPRIAATGQFLGTTLLGGAVGGAYGGREGIVPGLAIGAVGGALASPRAIVAQARFGVNTLGPALDRAANAAARFSPSVAAQLKAAVPAQTTAIMYGKAAAKEDRPRRVVLTER